VSLCHLFDDHQTALIVLCPQSDGQREAMHFNKDLIVAKTLVSSPTTRVDQKTLLLVGIALGYFMVLLDTTIVNVAGPAISHDLGGGLTGLQWVINAYTLVFASLLLGAGALSDQFGAKRVFLTGLVIFLVGSALSTATPSLAVLIGLRAILGIGGSMLLSASLTLISHAFPDPIQRVRATSMWGSITGLALVAGPVAGGILVDTLGWRGIFLINVPIALISLVITMRLMSETPRQSRRGFDLAGQLTSMLTVAALTFALIEGGRESWQSPLVLGSLGITLVSLLIFLVVETRSSAPMLPLRLFANANISIGMIAGLLINFGFSGILFVLSLFFQQARGYSALLTGLAFLPLTVVIPFSAPLVGRIINRIGTKVPMTIGFLLVGSGILLQAWVDIHTSYVVTLVGLLLMGLGLPLTIVSLLTLVMSNAPKELAGTASGALNASRQLGAVIGVAVLGAILSGYSPFVSGQHVALIVTGLLMLCGSLLVLTFVRHN
jgi:MFS transporter, DHA2 family, methylenomycin A resistance protein